jgi:hypothetical protein
MPKFVKVNPCKYWDARREIFFTYPEKPVCFQIEHSLVSISKWEAKWKKPFLSNTKERTPEEMLDYIRCMTITQNVDPNIYSFLPESVIEDIRDYIDDPMTATTISTNGSQKSDRTVITSELIYYWMTAFQIPFTCEKWHFNRLMTLIRICDIKNSPQKKMGANEMRARNRKLNAERRRAMHTKG